jgi:peptidyl-dipeptidase A
MPVGIVVIAALLHGCNSNNNKDMIVKEFQDFLKNYEANVVPLLNENNVVSWNSQITGKDQDYKKAANLQFKVSKIYSSKEDFAKLKKFVESGAITDPIMNRELKVLYYMYWSNQTDSVKLKKMVDLQTEIEKKFNT